MADVTNPEKMRALPWALAGNAANIVYVHLAFSGPVFLLFLDKLELDKTQIGLLLSLIPFCNVLGLAVAPATARIGYKRTYLVASTIRKFILALMVATPWVLASWGHQSAFFYVASVILGFAIARAVAIGALIPWFQELVPNAVRGKFSALDQINLTLLGAVILAAAGLILGDDPKLESFTILFGIALFVGLASVGLYSRVPGGASIRGDSQQRADFGAMLGSLRDRQFMLFLAGGSLVSLGWAPLSAGAFAPLFLKEQIGLEPNQVLYYNAVLLGAGVLSGFLWGWVADRYGSKPVMLITLSVLFCYPAGLWILPRSDSSSFAAALSLGAIVGLVLPGWSVSYARMLFVRIIPPERRSGYAAVHLAVIGLMQGAAPLLAGLVIEAGGDLQKPLGPLTIDRYTPLIVSGMILMGAAIVLLSRLSGDSNVPVKRFAGLFLQGNALGAMQGLISYQFGGVETKRVSTIERLGATRSPLSVEELIESLHDPSFNVRFETVVSIARTRPDSRLTAALFDVLRLDEPDMSIAAAWALGRLGDARAIEPLRESLESKYPLLRARAARALGSLGDAASAPILIDRLQTESDAGVKLAYGSALGALRHVGAMKPLLDLLDVLEDVQQRKEATLAVASIAGREDWFVRLARSAARNPGDAIGGVLLSMRRRLLRDAGAQGQEHIDAAVRAFGENRLEDGTAHLRRLVKLVPTDRLLLPARTALRYADEHLAAGGPPRLDHLLLVVHVLHTGFGASAAVEGSGANFGS